MQNRSTLLLFLLVMTSVSDIGAQTIYKSVGPDGKVLYSDVPPNEPPARYETLGTSTQAPQKKPSPDQPPSARAGSNASGFDDQDAFFSKLRRDSERLLQQPDFDSAMAAEKEALASAERASPQDPKIIERLLAMAIAYRQHKNYADAISIYNHVINIAGRSEKLLMLHVYNELALSYNAIGRNDLARGYLERAAAVRSARR